MRSTILRLQRALLAALLLSFGLAASAVWADDREAPRHSAELVFPLHPQHNHAPGVVECPNGDLLVSWYRGSGERTADDVAVYGARRKKGQETWSEPFLMADHPGFPDGNTALYVDAQERLWLFWPLVIANSWESCLTHYQISSDYQADGAPHWSWHGVIPLKPVAFEEETAAAFEHYKKTYLDREPSAQRIERFKKLAASKIDRRLGWQPRCKPTVLPSGRMLLPLYSDTFSVSLMAITDDGGKTWFASRPLAGFGNIQPAVLRRASGTLVAYMRGERPTRSNPRL